MITMEYPKVRYILLIGFVWIDRNHQSFFQKYLRSLLRWGDRQVSLWAILLYCFAVELGTNATGDCSDAMFIAFVRKIAHGDTYRPPPSEQWSEVLLKKELMISVYSYKSD